MKRRTFCLFGLAAVGHRLYIPKNVHAATSAQVTITCDDTLASIWNTGALYNLEVKNRLHVTFFVNPPRIYWGAGYLNLSQLRRLAANGHEIGAHTINHPHLTMLSVAQRDSEIGGSMMDLRNNLGFDVRTFAYPYGEYNDAVIDSVRKNGFIAARDTDNDLNYPGQTDLYRLHARSLKSTTPFTGSGGVKSQIDAAVSGGGWYILTVHDVDPQGGHDYVPIGTFNLIIDYVASLRNEGKISVVTLRQGISNWFGI